MKHLISFQTLPLMFAFMLLLQWQSASGQDPNANKTDNDNKTASAGSNISMTARPWLRICDGADRYILTGEECSGGYMFAKPFKPLSSGMCICGNGIWILKSGYCDTEEPIYVLFANGNDCFNIKTKVRWFRYIGHPETTRLETHYIVSGDWDYVEELQKTSPSRLVASPEIWTLAVGDDPENIYLPDELTCFRSDWRPLGTNKKATGGPYVRVGRSGAPPPLSVVDAHQAQRLSYCPYYAKEEFTVWIYAGGMLSYTKNKRTIYTSDASVEVHGNCHQRCTNVPPFDDAALNTTESPVTVRINPEFMIPDYPFSAEDSLGKQLSDLEDMPNTTNSMNTTKERNCYLVPEAVREMDKQTVRMIRTQAGFSLKQIKTPRVVMKEYQYLQISRSILAIKCPEIPMVLVKSLLRMFRVALNETTYTHPYRETGQNSSHDRILSALYACTNETLGGSNETMNAVYNKTACPNIYYGMQYKVNNSEATRSIRNCSGRIPKTLKFDNCKHDLVMEVAWKTILFTHYTCSRFFMNYSTDVSEYYTVMERLFNPDLLVRFYNPGNAYKGMKFVFQMFDLEKFNQDLDRCLGCARDISQYRAWLKRPKDLRFCPMNGVENPANGYNFDMQGYVGIPKNPVYIPYKKMAKMEYQCYSSWYDGLYTRPRQPVKPTCGLGIHVIGQTAMFA